MCVSVYARVCALVVCVFVCTDCLCTSACTRALFKLPFKCHGYSNFFFLGGVDGGGLGKKNILCFVFYNSWVDFILKLQNIQTEYVRA